MKVKDYKEELKDRFTSMSAIVFNSRAYYNLALGTTINMDHLEKINRTYFDLVINAAAVFSIVEIVKIWEDRRKDIVKRGESKLSEKLSIQNLIGYMKINFDNLVNETQKKTFLNILEEDELKIKEYQSSIASLLKYRDDRLAHLLVTSHEVTLTKEAHDAISFLQDKASEIIRRYSSFVFDETDLNKFIESYQKDYSFLGNLQLKK